MQPITQEIKPAPLIVDAFRRFKNRPGCLLLDSAMQIQSADCKPLGRYSFLMAEPFETLIASAGDPQPLQPIRSLLKKFQHRRIPDLPPFQGGIAGLLSYDLNRTFESIPPSALVDFKIPSLAFGCYDTVVAWDHEQQRAWIISTGFPETDPAARIQHAMSRLKDFNRLLEEPISESIVQHVTSQRTRVDVSGQFPSPGPTGLTSNFSEVGYRSAVQKCIDYIYAGDVFQINLAQRLLYPSNCHAAELYERLRACNPAPFSGYFDLSRLIDDGKQTFDVQIVSASPERFISVRDRNVESRPIKGTRRRTGIPLVDIQAHAELSSSVKDRAENTMIVDLMRNDLARCCTDESIRVTQLCELERYQSVLHLVSAVQGRLRPDCDLVELIAAIFPGGSITGAPKIRAMEIIAELEPHARGAYCGALGYLGFDGNADFSILIRTITAAGGWWQIPVGGGIVSQSNPQQEYEETWTKAAGMLRALKP